MSCKMSPRFEILSQPENRLLRSNVMIPAVGQQVGSFSHFSPVSVPVVFHNRSRLFFLFFSLFLQPVTSMFGYSDNKITQGNSKCHGVRLISHFGRNPFFGARLLTHCCSHYLPVCVPVARRRLWPHPSPRAFELSASAFDK